MKITNKVVDNIKINFLDLTELAYMYKLFFNESWALDIFPASIVKLKRLNILADDNNLTGNGESILLDCLDEPIDKPSSNDIDRFDEIWFIFPKDDEYGAFSSTRPIRYNKQETKRQYQVALEEYTHEQLLNALQCELQYRRSSGTENKLKYMKSSVNWFKSKEYLEFIDSKLEAPKEMYGKTIV